MIVPKHLKLKNTIKHPTTLIIGGASRLGIEMADSLIKQGGYVILVDSVTSENIEKISKFQSSGLLSFLDFTTIPYLDEDLRRLDYVFYFGHESVDFRSQVSTQEFLTFSNYLDATLALASKFEAKFLLTTSIKAQQLLYTDNLFFNKNIGIQFTQVYTDMEVQRYAEGLVMEYHEKADLDSRVIRLGEIIGEGMDFSVKSAFNELITQAAQGSNLLLKNDGLEQEWYIHIIDATYGLIKALFSKDTKGKYYSLSYDNTYTHLSIAYKIQEVDDEVKEIRFLEDDSISSSIKIQKPAPNLSVIGWMPRIAFDKAVKQALAAAKIYLAEYKVNQYEDKIDTESIENKGVGGKLKKFLNFSDESEEDLDPVERMIRQREKQEMIKAQKLQDASNAINSRRRNRNKGIMGRLNDLVWVIFVKLSNVFTSLKRRSPAELAIISFFSIAFIIFYILVLSPSLVVGWNTANLLPASEKTYTELSNRNYSASYNSAVKSKKAVSEIQSTLPSLKGIITLAGTETEYNNLVQLLAIYEKYFDGVQNILFAYSSFDKYLATIENNIQNRVGTDTFLSTTSAGINASSVLSEIKDKVPFLVKGRNDALSAIESIQESGNLNIPSFARQYISRTNQQILNSQNFVKQSEMLQYFPEFMAINDTKTYLVYILDSSRPAPIGGEISGVATVTIQNGSILQVQLQSASSISSLELSAEQKAAINETRYRYLENFDATSLSSVSDLSNLLSLSSDIWQTRSGLEIEGIILLDIISIGAINNHINQQPENLSSSIFELVSNNIGASASLRTRTNKITEISSYVFSEILNIFKAKNTNIEKVISDGLINGDIRIILNKDSSMYSYLSNNKMNDTEIRTKDLFIVPSLLVADEKLTNNIQETDIVLTIESTVSSEDNLSNRLIAHIPVLGTGREFSICIPLNTELSSIKVNGISAERTTVNRSRNSTCIVANLVNEDRVEFTWNQKLIGVQDRSEYNLDIAVANVNGANTRLDYSIAGQGVQISNSSLPMTGSNIIFSENINTYLEIGLEITR